MKKQFIPYELALQLKELGFKENCLGVYDAESQWFLLTDQAFKMAEIDGRIILAPLWQQAFDWFRVKHGLHVDIRTTFSGGKRKHLPYIHINGRDYPLNGSINEPINFSDYDVAKLEVLKRLIHTVEISK